MLPSDRRSATAPSPRWVTTVGACAALTQTRADTTSPSPTSLASAGNMAAGSKPSGIVNAPPGPTLTAPSMRSTR